MVSTGVIGFTRVRPGARSVHPITVGTLGFALGVVVFIRPRCVHSGSLRVSLVLWVHSGTPWR